MGKPVNIASTAHAQHAEMQQLVGALPTGSQERTELLAQIEALTTELAAEKEAHAKTQAALTAATAAPAA